MERIYKRQKIKYSRDGKNLPYRKGRLYDHDGNMQKRWFISYQIWDANKECMVRKRIYVGTRNVGNREKRYHEARQMIEELNELLANGHYIKRNELNVIDNILTPEGVGKMTIHQAVDVFEKEKKEQNAHNTWQSYRKWGKNLKRFLTSLGHYNGKIHSKITLKEFDATLGRAYIRWMKDQGLANRTINNNMITLATLLNYYTSIDEWLYRQKPLRFFKKLPVETHKHQAYSLDQVTAIKRECLQTGQDHLWLFIQFMFYCLARPNQEVRQIKIKHIQGDRLWIPPSSSKNNKGDYVSIPKVFQVDLDKLNLDQYDSELYLFANGDKPGREPVGRLYMWRRFTNVRQAVGLNGSGRKHDIYAFKHSGAINMYLSGIPLDRIQRQCRHQTINQTMEYLRDLDVFRDSSDYDQLKGA